MKTEVTLEHNVPIIHYLKRVNNQLIYNRHVDFEPYLHVSKSANLPDLTQYNFSSRIKRVESSSKKAIDDKELIKIICYTPSDVGWLRRNYFEPNSIPTYEADIVFTKRFMIDNDIKQDNSKKLYYDMECATDKTFATDYKQPTTVHGYFVDNVYHQFVWHPNYKQISKQKTVWTDRLFGTQHQWNIYRFPTEKQMLLKIVQFIRYIAPDVITEFSRDFFDIPWLYYKLQSFGIDMTGIIPININKKVYADMKNPNKIQIPFYETVNICNLYKNYRGSGLDSYSLDAICKREFKQFYGKEIGKYKHIENYTKAWMDDTEEFLKYNLCDVELMVNLDKTLKLFAHQKAIIDYTGCEFNDIGMNKAVARIYLYNKARQYGVVAGTLMSRHIYTINHSSKKPNVSVINMPHNLLETRTISDESYVSLIETQSEIPDKGKDSLEQMNKKGLNIFSYKGAFVGEPCTTDLLEDIWLFDWKRMYPAIIVANNMSPETLVTQIELEKYRKEGRMEQLHDIGNVVYFKKSPIGFLPRVLTELFDLRTNIKNEMKKFVKHSAQWEALDNKQQGVKALTNTFYGIMKLICFWIAESTTFKGREMIKWTIEECEKMGYVYRYSDTDSVYCTPTKGTKGIDISHELTKRFKDKWGVDCEIEFEGHFKKGMFFAKKRYALIDDDNNMKFRGIEIRRSDNSQFVKKIQMNIIKMLFEDNKKDEILKYIRVELKQFPNNKLSEIGVPHKLNFEKKSANNYFHDGARWSNAKLNKEYKSGDKPYYVRAFNNVGGLCFDDDDDNDLILKNVKINFEKHKERTALMKINNLFNSFGWDMTELYNHKLNRKWKRESKKSCNT